MDAPRNSGMIASNNTEHQASNTSSKVDQIAFGARRALRGLGRVEDVKLFALLADLELRRRLRRKLFIQKLRVMRLIDLVIPNEIGDLLFTKRDRFQFRAVRRQGLVQPLLLLLVFRDLQFYRFSWDTRTGFVELLTGLFLGSSRGSGAGGSAAADSSPSRLRRAGVGAPFLRLSVGDLRA